MHNFVLQVMGSFFLTQKPCQPGEFIFLPSPFILVFIPSILRNLTIPRSARKKNIQVGKNPVFRVKNHLEIHLGSEIRGGIHRLHPLGEFEKD